LEATAARHHEAARQHLGAKHLPNPMVKNTELQTVPEQNTRRRRLIGLPARFDRKG
jgi:hypothetical protein